jgi:methylated-DNA-[protein]-cysteine S-methyltransferase
MPYDAVIVSPIGPLGLRCEGGRLAEIDFLPADHPLQAPTGPFPQRVAERLKAYFKDPNTRFDLPLTPAATAFQQRVREAMLAIPVGQTRSYGDIARRLHSAPRPVGGACRHNPVPIIVPCHRVLAAAGLGGYGGETQGPGLDIKRWLLRHEGTPFPDA